MENPFLCVACQPLGYCRKHHKVASEKVLGEFDEAFYQRVNPVSKQINISQIKINSTSSLKLASLEAIRSLYRITPQQVVINQQEKETFVSNILGVSKIEFTNENPSLVETCCS